LQEVVERRVALRHELPKVRRIVAFLSGDHGFHASTDSEVRLVRLSQRLSEPRLAESRLPPFRSMRAGPTSGHRCSPSSPRRICISRSMPRGECVWPPVWRARVGWDGLLLRPRGRRARPDRGQQRRDLPLGAIQAGEQSLPVPLTVGFQGPEGRRRRSSGQVRSHGFTSWARGARIVSQRRGRLCAVAHTTAPVRLNGHRAASAAGATAARNGQAP
jgi:hypothetical protein